MSAVNSCAFEPADVRLGTAPLATSWTGAELVKSKSPRACPAGHSSSLLRGTVTVAWAPVGMDGPAKSDGVNEAEAEAWVDRGGNDG